MPKIKGWTKDRDRLGITAWRSIINPDLTVEIVSFRSQDMDEESGWGYGYYAIGGKGVPNTPEFFEDKEEAKKWAIKWMKRHPRGYLLKY